MLARVIEIDDLDRAGKVLLGQIPDPLGPIAHDDLLLCAAPAALPSFHIKPFAKLIGGFDGARVGGRIPIAGGVAFPVPRNLGEHAPPLCFAPLSPLAVRLSPSPSPFLLHSP